MPVSQGIYIIQNKAVTLGRLLDVAAGQQLLQRLDIIIIFTIEGERFSDARGRRWEHSRLWSGRLQMPGPFCNAHSLQLSLPVPCHVRIVKQKPKNVKRKRTPRLGHKRCYAGGKKYHLTCREKQSWLLRTTLRKNRLTIGSLRVYQVPGRHHLTSQIMNSNPYPMTQFIRISIGSLTSERFSGRSLSPVIVARSEDRPQHLRRPPYS
jgi:hypothetical protein